jgi:hypothetical protein
VEGGDEYDCVADVAGSVVETAQEAVELACIYCSV